MTVIHKNDNTQCKAYTIGHLYQIIPYIRLFMRMITHNAKPTVACTIGHLYQIIPYMHKYLLNVIFADRFYFRGSVTFSSGFYYEASWTDRLTLLVTRL